jgi:hypothetical protein
MGAEGRGTRFQIKLFEPVHPDPPFISWVFDVVDQVWLRHYPHVKPKVYQLALPAAPEMSEGNSTEFPPHLQESIAS